MDSFLEAVTTFAPAISSRIEREIYKIDKLIPIRDNLFKVTWSRVTFITWLAEK